MMILPPTDTYPKSFCEALILSDFSSFIAKCFHTLNPATPYLHNWHIDLVADRLARALQGKTTRLIINVPPRSLKSLCVSVAWPAWILGHFPESRIMAASYSQALSLKHSLDCRSILLSPWYRALFPHTQLAEDQNEKAKFATTRHGFRFATSVGGTATGEGGNFLIVDDPHTPMQAASGTQRQGALEWFDHTFASRLDDKHKGVIVVVMQRLHQEDLTGWLLAKAEAGWEHLCLPAIAEKRQVFTFGTHAPRQKIRKAGEILHPAREDKKLLARAQAELGSYAFAAQYQQQPVPEEGRLILPEWLHYAENLPEDSVIYQSWDTAISTTSASDYSVCTTWAVAEERFILLDVLRRKMAYPELRRTVLSQAEKWQPAGLLVEDKASGQSLIQELKSSSRLPVIAIRPTQDKQTRLCLVLPLFEAGKVELFPKTAPWRAEFESELFAFPACPHDDQVDSTTQFLQYIRKVRGTGEGARIRSL